MIIKHFPKYKLDKFEKQNRPFINYVKIDNNDIMVD